MSKHLIASSLLAALLAGVIAVGHAAAQSPPPWVNTGMCPLKYVMQPSFFSNSNSQAHAAKAGRAQASAPMPSFQKFSTGFKRGARPSMYPPQWKPQSR
jgi:hypothetical protein